MTCDFSDLFVFDRDLHSFRLNLGVVLRCCSAFSQHTINILSNTRRIILKLIVERDLIWMFGFPGISMQPLSPITGLYVPVTCSQPCLDIAFLSPIAKFGLLRLS